MISKELQNKIDRSIRLLQSVAPQDGSPIEVAYSGGKDSDVILQLTKESGVNYRAIYKNTTIDPPGTIAHAREMGAEIVQPKDGITFVKLVEKKGFPSRQRRFCCAYLKEYKILDKSVIGVRKSESTRRAKRYNEPTGCRFYGKNKDHVEQIYPILEWTSEDVESFIKDRNIKCAPVYYDEEGNFHVERRLGCMCCPLAYYKKRIEEFKKYPQMVKIYVRAGEKYMESHPDSVTCKEYKDAYAYFVRNVFYDSQEKWRYDQNNLFGYTDYKAFIENFFGIEL